MSDKFDVRVFKSWQRRLLFAAPCGLAIAFLCGGWLPLVEPNARQWSYVPWFALYSFWCAGMLFFISKLIDDTARSR